MVRYFGPLGYGIGHAGFDHVTSLTTLGVQSTPIQGIWRFHTGTNILCWVFLYKPRRSKRPPKPLWAAYLRPDTSILGYLGPSGKDTGAIFRMDISFYVGLLLWPLLKPLYGIHVTVCGRDRDSYTALGYRMTIRRRFTWEFLKIRAPSIDAK